MRVRPSSLCLSLLASLGTIGIAPAIAGETGLALVIDTATLADQICDEGPSKKKGSLAECQAIIRNGAAPPNWGIVEASPLRMASAEPLVTSCGVWDAMLTLDPLHLWPVPREASEDVSEQEARGVPALVLEMSTNFHLTSRETGQTVDFALRPGHKTGSWRLSQARRSPGSIRLATDGADRVLTFEGCFPAWVFDDPTLEVIPNDECEICDES